MMRYRTAIATAAALSIVMTIASALPAIAYVDYGVDAAGDGAGVVPIVDVVWAKRAVWQSDTGRRWFKVAFRAVDLLGRTTVDVEVRVDSRGDERADDLISFFRDGHTKVCNMGKGIEPRNHAGRVRMRGRYAACIVPLRWLRPGGKRIRWRLLSQTREGGSAYHFDRAPDHGWFR
jgi:hypothetical protein